MGGFGQAHLEWPVLGVGTRCEFELKPKDELLVLTKFYCSIQV